MEFKSLHFYYEVFVARGTRLGVIFNINKIKDKLKYSIVQRTKWNESEETFQFLIFVYRWWIIAVKH